MRRKGILPWCQNGNGGFFIGQFAWRKGGLFRSRKLFLANVLTIIGRVVFSEGERLSYFLLQYKWEGGGSESDGFRETVSSVHLREAASAEATMHVGMVARLACLVPNSKILALFENPWHFLC